MPDTVELAGASEYEIPDDATIQLMDQPIEVRMRKGTRLHAKILDAITSRINLSEKHISKRYDDWDRIDEHVRCYINLSQKAIKVDGTTSTTKKEHPFERGICVPLSYTLAATRQVGLMNIFTNRNPVIQLEGAGTEDIPAAKGMELVTAYDWREMSGFLFLLGLCQDADKYGLAVGYDEWYEKKGWSYVPNPVLQSPIASGIAKIGRMLFPSMKPPDPVIRQFGTTTEYNKFTTLDPFWFWPDPRVPMSCIEQMEFIGHTVFRGYLNLLEQKMPNGPYFNLEDMRALSGHNRARTTSERSRSRNNLNDFSLGETADEKDRGFYDLDHMQWKLIPREWKLSESSDPEIWCFTRACEELIIRAHPLPNDHGEFTYSIGESNYDPHTLFNPGVIENLDAMQRVADWYVNSHIANTRRQINNASIISPTYLEMTDVEKPNAAGHYRLTPEGEKLVAQGQVDPTVFMKQVPILDMTQGHLEMTQLLTQMAQEMAALNDMNIGQQMPSKRTLGEIQRVVFGQERRIGMTAQVIDEMAIQKMVKRMILNRQQFTTIDRYYRIVGEQATDFGDPRRFLKRTDILGNFDYIANTGSMPPDPTRFADTWMTMLMVIPKIPQLFQPDAQGRVLDIRKMVNEAAKALGVKNIKDFYMTVMAAPVQVLPDEQIQKEAQAGNIIPAPAELDPLAMQRRMAA
jgi:hypothetical protein